MAKRRCLFCNDRHPPAKRDITLEKKLELIKKEKRCWNCLGQNHQLQAVGHIHPEKERSVRRLRLRGTIPQAEDIELVAIEQPEIGNVAGSSKTEFASELWSQGYHLADDRILSGKAASLEGPRLETDRLEYRYSSDRE
ncbi:hypothetical protein GHT06_022502 [Daphnia sinensis]|uniref:Uncharacterized protein n=1 Tax=Daphnia sinensis TaxID=1820382 RepID=A0AAD5PR64_9CRUS|nr:hypothetical protein GHT06_022502 [Daphnia sinensis]